MREGSSEWWGREECEGYLATLTWVWIVLRGNEVPCHGKCLWSRRLWVLLTPRSNRIMEDALQRLADRPAGRENALMQERTAGPSAEADLQSLRAQVTPTSPTGCRPQRSGGLSGSCCFCGAVSVANRTSGQPCCLEVGQVPVGGSSLAPLGSSTAEPHIECDC